MTESQAYTDLFTASRKAGYWNDFYQCPSNLFETLMVQRRDYAHAYICRHFDRTARILDLGCGAGVLSEKLIESGYQVTCADASSDMLELCRERLSRFSADTHTVVNANCLDLPFQDQEFDVVVTLGMFGYFDEVSLALREIHRALRPGGTLILSVRNPNNQYVFDLFELLRLPLRLTTALIRKLARHRSRGASIKPSSTPPATISGAVDDGFRIRMFQNPPPLIKNVRERGYELVHFDGIGYGPLAIYGRELLPARVSIMMSNLLNRCFQRTKAQRLTRWIADVSFYAFKTIPYRR
jgi:ubiquinone/menaquinone biosynthesis C-methylase UbiE